MSAKKINLPKGLPPLPPVPTGWDAWDLCGWGGLKRKENGTPWGTAVVGSPCWNYGPEGHATGFLKTYYIEAVKKPAPAPAKKAGRAEGPGLQLTLAKKRAKAPAKVSTPIKAEVWPLRPL